MTLLKQGEAADLLALSERTLERFRVSGTGPKFVRLGRTIRYRLTDIEAFIEARIGIYGLPISDPRHLIGSFSGHLQHCCLLYIDEAFAANNATAEGRLKNLVIEPTIIIEPKYFQPFQLPNVLHVLLASNNDWVVPAGHGSRRYAVYNVSDSRIGDF